MNNVGSCPIFTNVFSLTLHQYNIPRENLVIMTKVFFLVSPDPSTLTMLNPALGSTRDFINQGGLSRAAIFNQVEASLRRLDTGYIDLLQIHTFDPTTPLEETMKALHDLVVSGKVRYLGACNMRTWQFAEMNRVAEVNGWTKFVSIQVEHSLLYRPEVCSDVPAASTCCSLTGLPGIRNVCILQLQGHRHLVVLPPHGWPPCPASGDGNAQDQKHQRHAVREET